MCCHLIKKPKFNDVCSRMLEMHSKRLRFQNYSLKAGAKVQVFSISTYSIAFATYLKPY